MGGNTEQFFLGAVSSHDKYEEPWSIGLHINRKPVQFKINTGADISVISASTYQALPERPKLKPSNAVLSSPGGILSCKGQFTADISLKNKLCRVEIYVTEGPKIELTNNTKPYCINAARKVPFPLLPKGKEELNLMLKEGIIEDVTELTDWCAPTVPVVKPNGKIRICVDLRKLNEVVIDTFYLPLEDVAPKLVH